MNIIRNGGFESGALSPGWRQIPGSALLDGGVTDATSHTGNYCLELRAIDFVEQMFFHVATIGDLTFRAKVESEITAGPFYLRIEYTDSSENMYFLGPSTSWEEFSYRVDNSKRLFRIQFGTGETGSVYIDDVYLDGFLLFSPPYSPWYHLFYARGFMWPSEMMEEQAMFEYGSAMEDRLAQIESQLTQLASKLSAKRDKDQRRGKPTKT